MGNLIWTISIFLIVSVATRQERGSFEVHPEITTFIKQTLYTTKPQQITTKCLPYFKIIPRTLQYYQTNDILRLRLPFWQWSQQLRAWRIFHLPRQPRYILASLPPGSTLEYIVWNFLCSGAAGKLSQLSLSLMCRVFAHQMARCLATWLSPCSLLQRGVASVKNSAVFRTGLKGHAT